MTPEELRELDNWLAVIVMKWTATKGALQPKDESEPKWWWTPDGKRRMSLWRPTTDPASCDKLLDKISEEGWTWVLTFGSNTFDFHMWRTANGEFTSAADAAETKFLAVCLCAKKAYS